MKISIVVFLMTAASIVGAEINSGRIAVLKSLNNTKFEKTPAFFRYDVEDLVDYMHTNTTVNFIIHREVYSVATRKRLNLPKDRIPVPLPKGNPNLGLLPAPATMPAFWSNIEVEVGVLPTLPKIQSLAWPLRNVTAKQVLDATMMAFNPPLKYIVVDYGVIIMNAKTPYNVTRRIRINPSTGNKLK